MSNKIINKIKNKYLKSFSTKGNTDSLQIAREIITNNPNALKYITEVILSNKDLFDVFFKEAISSNSTDDRIREITIEDTSVGINNKNTREEWLEKALKAIPSGHKILDAGAGELQYKRFCSHLEYVSQDFAQFDPAIVKEGTQPPSWDNSKLDIVSDIIDIPVDDKSFDAIMCIEVFEHLPQPALAVKEFSRILKSGGDLIITAPFASLTHFAPYFFANGYSKYWYEKILGDAGFKIIEITPNGNYFDYLAQELRRIDSVASKYANDGLDLREGKMVKQLLLTMERMSRKGDASSELLNFGYHVLAKKI